MEKEKIKQAIEICREAYATLEDAKSDCKDVVESAIDALCGLTEEMGKKTHKEVLANYKDDIKSIKKIAKAMATGKLDDIKAESEALSQMVDECNLVESAF
jgi:hypothetical protein